MGATETFLPHCPATALPKLLLNQTGPVLQLPRRRWFRHGRGRAETLQTLELFHVLCVSQNDQQLLEQGFNLGPQRVSRLINAIETDVFRPGGSKKTRVVSFMPRKNSRDAAIVAALLHSQPWFAGWTLEPIQGLSQADVAQRLQKSLGFLAFGHPEGFACPLQKPPPAAVP